MILISVRGNGKPKWTWSSTLLLLHFFCVQECEWVSTPKCALFCSIALGADLIKTDQYNVCAQAIRETHLSLNPSEEHRLAVYRESWSSQQQQQQRVAGGVAAGYLWWWWSISLFFTPSSATHLRSCGSLGSATAPTWYRAVVLEWIRPRIDRNRKISTGDYSKVLIPTSVFYLRIIVCKSSEKPNQCI